VLRILVVEDNPTNQQVIRLILAGTGAELTMATMARRDWRPGDQGLRPGADGPADAGDGRLTAIRTIRDAEAAARLPRTPIAVVSANAMEHHRREAIEAGADLHIAKPLSPATLFAGIEQVLAA